MQPFEQAIAMHQPTHKMDILFYNSIQKSKQQYIKRSILHIIKLILICAFLPIDLNVLQTKQTLLIVFMSISIGVVTLNLLITFAIIRIAYGDNRQNNQFFVSLAKKLGHSITGEPLSSNEQFNRFTNCVSTTIYNQSTGALSNSEGLTQQIRDKYESIYTNLVSAQALKNSQCLSFFEKNGKSASFALLIFGIIGLSLSECNSAQIGVLVTFLILEALNVWIVLIFILIIALSPIIICFVCFFMCCCYKPAQINMPNTVQATTQIIQQTDGTCPICFQNFVPGQNVIILRCSNKHVFHDGCIDNWVRVSHTCPMCRKDISNPSI